MEKKSNTITPNKIMVDCGTALELLGRTAQKNGAPDIFIGRLKAACEEIANAIAIYNLYKNDNKGSN